ncbi:MAG: hypothetical protein WBB08_07920 [Halobacteriota archaeon]
MEKKSTTVQAHKKVLKNGGEYNNGVVSRLLRMLDVVDVPTEVESPKGNGKKDCEAVLINLFLKGFS